MSYVNAFIFLFPYGLWGFDLNVGLLIVVKNSR